MEKKDWKRIRPIASPTFSAKKMRMVRGQKGIRVIILHCRWYLSLRRAVIHWMRYSMIFVLKVIVLNCGGKHHDYELIEYFKWS